MSYNSLQYAPLLISYKEQPQAVIKRYETELGDHRTVVMFISIMSSHLILWVHSNKKRLSGVYVTLRRLIKQSRLHFLPTPEQ